MFQDNVPTTGTLYHPAGAASAYASGTFGLTELESWTRTALYTVTAGAGSGGVISPYGNVPAMPGENLRFAITADKDYELKDVTVDGASVGAVSSYTIENIREDHSIQATFRYIGHVHSYGDWRFDQENHWKECTAGDGARSEEAAHTVSGWTTDQPATETEAGRRHQECTVCHYVMQTEVIKPNGVTYTQRTLTDAATGVRVSGLFSSDAALAVRKNEVFHEKGTCPACDDIRARKGNRKLIALYDISLSAGSYQGELEVSVPVGDANDGQTVSFLHCNEKLLESRTLTVENGVVTGTFSSLASYAVAKSEESGSQPEKTPPQTGNTTPPQTGDTANTLPFVLLALAALLGCIGLIFFKKQADKKCRGKQTLRSEGRQPR